MSKVELYALAHHGRVRSTISKLRKVSGHTYHYVAVRQGWVSVYSASEPHQARSEWWLDCLVERGTTLPDQSFILVEACPNEQGLAWYCMVVEHGVVKKQWTQSQANWFQLSLEQIERYLLIGDVPGLSGEECAPASAQELVTLASYTLRKPRRFHVWAWAAAICLAVLGGAIYYPSPEQKPSSSTSPTLNLEEMTLPSWGLYRVALSHAFSSEQVTLQARNLATYLSQLPPGWKANAIVQVGHNLTVKITRQPQGQFAVMKAWLASRTEIARFTHWSGEVLTLHIPLYSGLPAWQDTVLPIEPSWQSLQDALTTIGATLTLQSIDIDREATWQTRRWNVTYRNAPLMVLTQMHALLEALPTGIDNLTLTPTPQQRWDVSFTLNLYGGL